MIHNSKYLGYPNKKNYFELLNNMFKYTNWNQKLTTLVDIKEEFVWKINCQIFSFMSISSAIQVIYFHIYGTKSSYKDDYRMRWIIKINFLVGRLFKFCINKGINLPNSAKKETITLTTHNLIRLIWHKLSYNLSNFKFQSHILTIFCTNIYNLYHKKQSIDSLNSFCRLWSTTFNNLK